jgi:hypothetical protein
MKPLLSYSDGAITIRLSLRGLSSVVRLMAPAFIDAANWGMHPASPYRAIVLRNRLARGRW